MLSGVVKNYMPDKGFGFIKPDDGSADAFIHATVVKAAGMEDLAEGDKVMFETGPGKNGKPRATSVKLAS